MLAQKTSLRLQLQFKNRGAGTAVMWTPIESQDYLVQQLVELHKAKQHGQPYMVRRSNGEVLGVIDTKELLIALIELVVIDDAAKLEFYERPNTKSLN